MPHIVTATRQLPSMESHETMEYVERLAYSSYKEARREATRRRLSKEWASVEIEPISWIELANRATLNDDRRFDNAAILNAFNARGLRRRFSLGPECSSDGTVG